MSVALTSEQLASAAHRLLTSSRLTLADAVHDLGKGTGNDGLLKLARRLGRDAIHAQVLDLLERALRGARKHGFVLYDEAVMWRSQCLFALGRYEECIEGLLDHYGDDKLGALGSEEAFNSLCMLGRKKEALERIDRALTGRYAHTEFLLATRARILREEGKLLAATADEQAAERLDKKKRRDIRIMGAAALVVAFVLGEVLAASTPWLLMTLRGVLAAVVLAIPIAVIGNRRRAAGRVRRLERSRTVQRLPGTEREALLRVLSR